MILVTGATGNVGREVVNLLLDDGQEVAAVTRNPAAAALPGGAHVVGGDPSRPQTLMSALRSLEAILISPRALGDASTGAATAELLALAAEQGAERVVALSAVTVQYPAGYRRFADAFKAVEDADAVLSGLSPRSNSEAGIASQVRGPSSRRCRQQTYGAWSLSAPHRSGPCLRLAARSRRNTTPATGSSCEICSLRW